MGIGSTLADTAKSLAGISEKAVLTIGDMGEIKIKENQAARPSSGNSLGGGNFADVADVGVFDSNLAMNFATNVRGINQKNKDFDFTGHAKTYRFSVQFNPSEIRINGYGGEELPIQNFGANHEDGEDHSQDTDENGQHHGSHMAAADTRIEMSFRIIFDKVDPQDAFYSDKFTMNNVSIAKGVTKGIMKAAGKKSNSVQPEVEALTAVVRDKNKRLAIFAWGDMSYQGIINSVNAEYTMFNINGEPIRAVVGINMVLYDETDIGPNVNIWQREYIKDFGKLNPSVSSPTDAVAALSNL